MPEPTPFVSAVVVHWRDEDHLAALLDAWPQDPRFELIVVDNGATLSEPLPRGRLLTPGRNLGFAGGTNQRKQSCSDQQRWE